VNHPAGFAAGSCERFGLIKAGISHDEAGWLKSAPGQSHNRNNRRFD
jgi:hypothetical protein